MSTCNRFDLQTLGSQPVNAQKSPRSLITIFVTRRLFHDLETNQGLQIRYHI